VLGSIRAVRTTSTWYAAVRVRHQNFLVGVGLLIGIGILCSFFTSLLDARAGEVAGALGAVVGGTIGAMGAALAVYLTLRGQREEEISKVSSAVLSEIAELCKSPMGQLGACLEIQRGMAVPSSHLKYLFATPKPVIYPAIADRVSRLPRPTLVVTFYMQQAETRGMIELITNTAPSNEFITFQGVREITDLLISQCQLAHQILRTAPEQPDEDPLLLAKRAAMVTQLDGQLRLARGVYPDAPSFQDQLASG
jgi:hypothetical protein